MVSELSVTQSDLWLPTSHSSNNILTSVSAPPLQTGSFSLPPEDTQQLLAAYPAHRATSSEDLPDSLSVLSAPLPLTPEPRPGHGRAGPRSAIGALLDPAADESVDDLMSLCSGKFDGE